MPTNKQVLDWFEIPVRQLDKAAAFYTNVLRRTLKHEDFGGMPHAMFVTDDPMTSGAIVQNPHLTPGATGALIYFKADDGVEACLARAVEHGGKVVMPVTSIGPQG